jgi:hypothetical protein
MGERLNANLETRLIEKKKADARAMTEAQKLEAVKIDGYAIKYMENPSEAIQLAAINECESAFMWIKTPTEAAQLRAVTRYAWNIEHIENPSEAMKLAAVKSSGYVISTIRNPSPELINVALREQSLINNKERYESWVDVFFKDNAILMKKWLRYGETMRA